MKPPPRFNQRRLTMEKSNSLRIRQVLAELKELRELVELDRDAQRVRKAYKLEGSR